MDIQTLVLVNLFLSIQLTPLVLVSVTIIRGVLLLRGRKREFEDWTRNPLMAVLSIIFLPGTLIYIGIRYAITRLARIRVDRISGSSTYGEVNLFLVVEDPPSLGIVLVALYSTLVLTVFVALTLLVLPLALVPNLPLSVLLWYVGVGTFYNASVRSGDASLVLSSLRDNPRRGALELVAFIALLYILQTQLVVMIL